MTTLFKQLTVGTRFIFKSEVDFPWSGMARGPWVKVSARKYRHLHTNDEHGVGTIRVEVIPANDPPDRPTSPDPAPQRTVTELRHGDRFRIGYTEYQAWTLEGFYAASLRDSADKFERHGWDPVSTIPIQTFEAYRAEQHRRGSADRGASPQAAVLVGDPVEAARRADAFRALPELSYGDHVLLYVRSTPNADTLRAVMEKRLFTVERHHNKHVKFTPVFTPVDDIRDIPNQEAK
jgi:hypothetical protein